MDKHTEAAYDLTKGNGMMIVNIHRGKGERAGIVYAELIAKDGHLLISATLDYIVEKLSVLGK